MNLDCDSIELILINKIKDKQFSADAITFFINYDDLYQKMSLCDEGIVEGFLFAIRVLKEMKKL